jgi:hypothetical protein
MGTTTRATAPVWQIRSTGKNIYFLVRWPLAVFIIMAQIRILFLIGSKVWFSFIYIRLGIFFMADAENFQLILFKTPKQSSFVKNIPKPIFN